MQIRPAAASDLPSITRIYNEAIIERIATADLDPRTSEDRVEWFKQFDSRHPIWVGEELGAVVGYGALHTYSPREGYRFAVENAVYVAASERGRGFGRAMLEHVLAQATAIGFHYMLARVFTHNVPSIRLHASLGFRELGVQHEVVQMDGRWFDVTLMDRKL
jgi:L-amino acid N-acyltransferase YncA